VRQSAKFRRSQPTYRRPCRRKEMTQEIAHNVGQAAKGTADVASNITNVNVGAVATRSASTQVLQAARSLSTESNHLKSAVENFLSTVRAA
jgi:methyl-accepting chemotaxis protein